MNPNGSHIEAKLFSIFLLVKRWLSVGISTLNVSLCLSQFKPSILVSFAFVPRCSFAKFNYFSELRLLVFKFGSLEWHLWSLNPPFLKQFYGIRLYFFNFLQAFYPSHQIINVHIISDLFWRDGPFSRQSSREYPDSDLAEASYTTLNFVDSAFFV